MVEKNGKTNNKKSGGTLRKIGNLTGRPSAERVLKTK